MSEDPDSANIQLGDIGLGIIAVNLFSWLYFKEVNLSQGSQIEIPACSRWFE